MFPYNLSKIFLKKIHNTTGDQSLRLIAYWLCYLLKKKLKWQLKSVLIELRKLSYLHVPIFFHIIPRNCTNDWGHFLGVKKVEGQETKRNTWVCPKSTVSYHYQKTGHRSRPKVLAAVAAGTFGLGPWHQVVVPTGSNASTQAPV